MAKREAVSIDDRIWFHIPFTVYWIGKEGGDFSGICLWRKLWSPKDSQYYWEII